MYEMVNLLELQYLREAWIIRMLLCENQKLVVLTTCTLTMHRVRPAKQLSNLKIEKMGKKSKFRFERTY